MNYRFFIAILITEDLGTDPSYSVVNNPVESKDLNYDEMDKELRALQATIREASQVGRVEPNDRLVYYLNIAIPFILLSLFLILKKKFFTHRLTSVVLRAQEVSTDTPNDNQTACFRIYVSQCLLLILFL